MKVSADLRFLMIVDGKTTSQHSKPLIMSNRPAQIALITVGTLLAGAAGYAVYFDYMRRNSPEFRKGLSASEEVGVCSRY